MLVLFLAFRTLLNSGSSVIRPDGGPDPIALVEAVVNHNIALAATLCSLVAFYGFIKRTSNFY
jgi:hypothetical protein